jgi:hypothetical protein
MLRYSTGPRWAPQLQMLELLSRVSRGHQSNPVNEQYGEQKGIWNDDDPTSPVLCVIAALYINVAGSSFACISTRMSYPAVQDARCTP